MIRYLLGGLAVLLAAAVVVFLLTRPKPVDDALARRLSALADAADRTCLSDTTTTSSADLDAQLALLKGASATAGVKVSDQKLRGAAEALPAAVQALQNDAIRMCMQPWAATMRDAALEAPAPG